MRPLSPIVYKFPLDQGFMRGYSGFIAETTAIRFGDLTLKADDDRHMAVFFRLYTTRTSSQWAGDGGDTREGMPDALSAGSPTLPFARSPRLATEGGSNTQGSIMSRNLEAATPAANQVNFLNRVFNRVSESGLAADSATSALSDVYRGLIGISAISQILIANEVAKDCSEPALDGHLAGGLLDAVNALSSFMIDHIEDLADHADRRSNDAEVLHD